MKENLAENVVPGEQKMRMLLACTPSFLKYGQIVFFDFRRPGIERDHYIKIAHISVPITT